MALSVMSDVLVQLPLVHVPLPLQHLHLPHQPLAVSGQGSVVGLQILSLNQPLGATVLGVASVLQGSSLLFELDNIFSRKTMKSLV